MLNSFPGLQGALLSHIMEPIFINKVCIGAPSSEKAVKNAILSRYGGIKKAGFSVKALHENIHPHGEIYHNWVAGIGIIANVFVTRF